MKQTFLRRLSSIIVGSAILLNASPAYASAFLVNTESFLKIDNGNGATDLELQFGATGKEIRWSIGENVFKFDDSVEILGTASGRTIHAQDQLQSSGSLAIEGAATFGSTVRINGVTYTFPFGDGSATGKVLKTDGAGNLSWSSDIDTTGSTSPGQGLTTPAAGVLSLSATHSGTTIEGTVLLSGATIHAQNDLQSSGTLVVEGASRLDGEVTFGSGMIIRGVTYRFPVGDGSASGKVLKTDGNGNLSWSADIDTDTNTTYSAARGLTLSSGFFSLNAAITGTSLEILGTASGRIVYAKDTLASSGTLVVEGQVTFGSLGNCLNLKSDANGVLSCNTTDYIEEAELSDMAELETQIGGSNIITSGEIDSESEFESVTGLSFFTGEEVEDQVATLLRAGTGITLTYNDAAGTFTIEASHSSGNVLNLVPEFDGAVYYSSGSTSVGQLAHSFDSTNLHNYYRWTTTNAAIQDYWIAVRAILPKNFSHWRNNPIAVNVRSDTTNTGNNHMTIRLLDSTGTKVALTSSGTLASTVNDTWRKVILSGPNSSGTFTAGSGITLLMKMAALSNAGAGYMDLGEVELNWATNHP